MVLMLMWVVMPLFEPSQQCVRFPQPLEPLPQYVARTSSPLVPPSSSSVEYNLTYGCGSSGVGSNSGPNTHSGDGSNNGSGGGVVGKTNDLDIRRVVSRTRAPLPMRPSHSQKAVLGMLGMVL